MLQSLLQVLHSEQLLSSLLAEMLIGEVVGEAGFLEGGDRSWFILSFSRKFLGVMVNRMVFFYVYVIAERFTSDFGESLLPVLFSPTEPKNTPIYMTSFKILKLNQRIIASVQGTPRRGNEHIAQGIALGMMKR